MHLLNFKITHHSAKIKELESTRFERIEDFYKTFSNSSNIRECMALQTCNRNEFYFIVDDLNSSISEIAKKIKATDKFEIERGILAINHLFNVASGIDSLVIGENQILNQIKNALETAKDYHAIGPILSHITQKALSVGKKVRNETGINIGAVSIGSIAVDFCKSVFGDLRDKIITVIGAGKIGTLVAKALLTHNIKATFVTNRTYQRALRLANNLNGKALKLDKLNDALIISDIIILATAAPHPIITKENLEEVIKKKKSELIIIDISVPRNIELNIELPKLKIYDIDELKSISEENRLKRLSSIKKAEKIIQEAIKMEKKYFQQQVVKPFIASFYTNAEKIRKKELEKLINMLENPSSDEIKNLDKFSQVLINRIFADLTESLKSATITSHLSDITL